MSINPKLVFRKINFILRDMQRLKPLSLLSFSDYQKNYDNEILSERYLERILMRVIDINYHLLTESNYASPKDYFESFTRLSSDLHIFSYDFCRRMARFSGLRNRLAHEYDEIDENKIHKEVKNIFRELPQYLRVVENFVNKSQKQKKLI